MRYKIYVSFAPGCGNKRIAGYLIGPPHGAAIGLVDDLLGAHHFSFVQAQEAIETIFDDCETLYEVRLILA